MPDESATASIFWFIPSIREFIESKREPCFCTDVTSSPTCAVKDCILSTIARDSLCEGSGVAVGGGEMAALGIGMVKVEGLL